VWRVKDFFPNYILDRGFVPGISLPAFILTDPMFHDETAARLYFESRRWPTGPHCGVMDVCRMEGEEGKLA
jgi:hypothetical protein